MKRSLLSCWLAPVLLLAAATAAAEGPAMAAEGSASYYCGGVGADERSAMRPLEAQANLKLLFVTQKRGGYLAGVQVAVSGAGTTRIETVADGPICLLRLPAGAYSLSARIGDASRAARVSVGAPTGMPQQVVIAFPGGPWDGIWASDEEKRQARQ